MPQTPETSSIHEQLAEIKREAEQKKVELTPEVQQYIRTHLEAVQQKLARQEDVTEDDIQFIQEVRIWVGLPEEDRNRFISIESMNDEINRNMDFKEAIKRKISLKQWLDLLHVAEAAGKKKEWIDETFSFPGGGRIEAEKVLDLIGSTSLISLPEGLKVNGVLDLQGCKSLTHLPADLEVNENLYLTGCISIASLPVGLKVGFSLYILGRNSLTSLPEDLEVNHDLYLSKNSLRQVKEDAKRLKKEGKIKGEIKYFD